ncbi:MAG TPA: hypothetical protein VG710_03720 [Opitutus sp.]|nr:hypothetical protein [Opitutus sp.]
MKSSRRRSSLRLFALLTLAAVFLAGCVTDDQVRSIVRDSNYQMLLAADPGLATTLSAQDGSSTANQDAAARTNAFLAAHPDDPAMANALRLRETLLYLTQRNFDLADATQKQINAGELHSARDKALAAAYDDLRWWATYSLAGEFEFFGNQKDAALQHIASLETRAASKEIVALPDLRDYFLEMRAWIGLKLGLATPRDPAAKQDAVEKAVNAWTNTFTGPELTLLNAKDFTSVKPFDLSTRRVIRARVLLTTLAQKTHGDANATFTFAQPAVNDFYAALPH